MSAFFITATGTGIGKTLVTAALVFQLKAKGKTVTALKPVITGYDPGDPDCDSAIILRSCGLAPAPPVMEAISPWRYAMPLAPSLAAKKENRPPVELGKLIAFCRDHETLKSDIVLAEGAGGVMAPLNDRHTMLDCMAALGWPAILVAGSYLGSISHTLTALEVLAARKLSVKALVVSESPDDAVSLEDTVQALQAFASRDVPVVKIPRLSGDADIWKQAPPIDWICDA